MRINQASILYKKKLYYVSIDVGRDAYPYKGPGPTESFSINNFCESLNYSTVGVKIVLQYSYEQTVKLRREAARGVSTVARQIAVRRVRTAGRYPRAIRAVLALPDLVIKCLSLSIKKAQLYIN